MKTMGHRVNVGGDATGLVPEYRDSGTDLGRGSGQLLAECPRFARHQGRPLAHVVVKLPDVTDALRLLGPDQAPTQLLPRCLLGFPLGDVADAGQDHGPLRSPNGAEGDLDRDLATVRSACAVVITSPEEVRKSSEEMSAGR